MSETRFDDKLARIRAGGYRRGDFIIADAKDADMSSGIPSVGLLRLPDGGTPRYRTRPEYLASIEELVRHDAVDIMLLSVSNLEAITRRGALEGSKVKFAIRANDATDIWRLRGAVYKDLPSQAFRTSSIRRALRYTDLGLYSITFNNNLDADYASLQAFAAFREQALELGFTYFLEVFNPNASTLSPEDLPSFVNDAIVRCLAGLTDEEKPRFLKIAYNGPKALEELASFDPEMVVGVLGGGAGTTRDCFELVYQAEKYGARVALFGRKINLAEWPLEMVRHMRAVADGDLTPADAVASYHDMLRKAGIVPLRPLVEDCRVTEPVLERG
ncbi:MAG: barrel motif-containing protein [Proteobacteria bacterium]|nr:barrel motif-containing protein [Pseudomonadota bacterium]